MVGMDLVKFVSRKDIYRWEDSGKYKVAVIDFGITGYLKGFEKSIVLNYNSHILKQEWNKSLDCSVNYILVVKKN